VTIAAALIVWAIWRAAAEPSARRDLLALVLLVVAGTARSGLLLLAPVLPAVVLLTGLRCGDGGIAARLRRTLREHVVLWVAVAIAAMPLLLAPLGVDAADSIRSRLAGGYPTTIHVDVWPVLEKMGSYFSRTVIGTGFFAAAVALPWLVVQLARARDRTRFAFAAVVVLAAAALVMPGAQDVARPLVDPSTVLVALVMFAAGLAVALAAAVATSREPLAAIAGAGLRDPALALALAAVTAGPEATGVPLIYAVLCLGAAALALMRR